MELIIPSISFNSSNIINLDKNVIIFGKNSIDKSNFLNIIKNGFLGKDKKVLLNGKIIDSKDYNVICIDEETDFTTEFKFTKNNILKQMIYDDVISKINEEKIVQYTNEIFDAIDDKINLLLERKINKKSDNNISFQIEVPNVNSIIDKFTNIYIDNILLDNADVTKSMKRKLLYQLSFWETENKNDKINIVIIDNFDVYLSSNEIIDVLNKITKLSNDRCHFILTSCNNIFEYLPINFFQIYKFTNKIIPFNRIDEGIKNYIIKKEYSKIKNDITYEDYYEKNEQYILNSDIDLIRDKAINKYSYIIGKILNCASIKFVNDRPKTISGDYIICNSKDEQELFLEISAKFVD